MSMGDPVTGSARGRLRWFQWDEMEEHLAISSRCTVTGDQGQGKCTDHSHWEAQVCSNSELLPGRPRRASWAGWDLLGSSPALSHGLFNPLVPTAPHDPSVVLLFLMPSLAASEVRTSDSVFLRGSMAFELTSYSGKVEAKGCFEP